MNKSVAMSLNRGLSLLGGIGLGAVLMYILDPERGKTRRALVRDKAGSLVHRAGNVLSGGATDIDNRAYGLFARATSLVRKAPVTDDELVAHIRSGMGQVVSHPGAIQVTADHGRVTLSGPILAKDVQPLIELAAKVPCVRQVMNHLTVYQNPDDIPALQGQPAQEGRA